MSNRMNTSNPYMIVEVRSGMTIETFPDTVKLAEAAINLTWKSHMSPAERAAWLRAQADKIDPKNDLVGFG